MNVFVMIIEHHYGQTVEVHSTSGSAHMSVVEYCRDNWESELGNRPQPDDSAELIQQYFDRVEREFYSVEEYEVLNNA